MPATFFICAPERSRFSQGAKTTGTNVNGFLAVQSDLANIGLPSSVGFPMGVRNVLTEHNSFTADATFCHFELPPKQTLHRTPMRDGAEMTLQQQAL